MLKLRAFTIAFDKSAYSSNPMALNYVNDTIEGDNPSVSYATVYPVCMFLRVIIIQVMLMLVL